MSNSENRNIEQRKRISSVDPYAGQYPPPPPLRKDDVPVLEEENLQQQQQPFYVLDQSQRQQSFHDSEPSQHRPSNLASNRSSQYSNRQSAHDSEPSQHASSSHRHSLQDENKSSTHVSLSSHHTIPEYTRGHYYETNNTSNAAISSEDYYDPEAVNLKDYLQAEREEKLRKQINEQKELQKKQPERYSQTDLYINQSGNYSNQPEHYRQQQGSHNQAAPSFRQDQHTYGPLDTMEDPYRHHHPPPRLEPMYYNSGQHFPSNEELYPSPMRLPQFNTSDLSPMPMPMFNAPQQQNSNALFSSPPPPPPPPSNFVPPPFIMQSMMQHQSSNPSILRPPPPPPPPPMMDNDPYRERGCCFGSTSFCAFICMSIMISLLLVGVGLIVAAKILENRCGLDEYRLNNNQLLCGKPLQNGFLYGGIVIASLSGIVVIWRMVRWCGTTPRRS